MNLEIERLYYEAAGLVDIISWAATVSENDAVGENGLRALCDIAI